MTVENDDTQNGVEPPQRGHGAFFGRRKGKTLRKGHAGLMAGALPDLRLDLDTSAPTDLRTLFPTAVGDIWLEIGFGGGEHLTQRAGENPDVGFIGCEAYINGTAKMLSQIEQNGLANIRLWDDDAKAVVEWLPEASIARIYLLYPDPWPKRRHRKRRFLGEDMLARLARILKPGGELRFATDIDDYAAYALARIARSPDFVWTAERQSDWLTPWEGWRSTRYEAKALREGRRGAYFTFRRIAGSADILSAS
ncbi:tRNA (guanine-N(7)-)-methyltransferase [Labrys miyagiensis]|uniref:tRNA (guanine-N(7)-)-methyltransferase n=1 Tax=Labrys miyagiensis TaxID=346912 RepID=A0ABQ6CJL7_9HYPH|nr:tRNA (guanosine(46)-N7)-methyltransferase TrmB [Labrys miyagiensis]GLS18411.1 tRNA (guanine-N(7)-)-methyltransferase [Labrys miyagiensis]